MAVDEEFLILITSTQKPYIKDSLDLLFLPSGVEFRFRYRQKWLPDDFKNIEYLNTLKNKKALLVHIQSIKINGKYVINEFIPIRLAKVYNIKFYGEILWISFILDKWVRYEERDYYIGKNKLHDYMKTITPLNSRDYVGDILYIVNNLNLDYIEDDIENNEELTIKYWFNIVKEIMKLQEHIKLNSIFIKLISITDLKCNTFLYPFNLLNQDNLNIPFTYELKSNTEYMIELIQYYPKGTIDKSFYYSINVDDKNIITLKERGIIQGRYDVLRYIIKTPKLTSNIYTYLKFSQENTSDKFTLAEPFLMLKVLGSKLLVIVSLMIIFFGLIFDKIVIQLTSEQFDTNIMIYSIIGGIASTIGLYLLNKD